MLPPGSSKRCGVAVLFEYRKRAIPPLDRLGDFEQSEAHKSPRGMIDQGIGAVDVRIIGIAERRQSDTIDAGNKLVGIFGASELFKKRIELLVCRLIEHWNWMAHLHHAAAQPVGMVGAIPLMKSQRAFCFPGRHRWEVGPHRLHESSLRPMQPEQSLNVFFDGVAHARGPGISCDSGEFGDSWRRVSHTASRILGDKRIYPRNRVPTSSRNCNCERS